MNIEVPLECLAILIQVLFEDAEPLFAVDVLLESLVCLGSIQFVKVQGGRKLNVRCELLVRLIVLVVDWAALKLDNSRESIHVIDGGCCSNFSTITVTSDRGHSNVLLIHESNNVIGHFLHTLTQLDTQLVEKTYIIVVGGMMVRATLISVV